MASACTFFTSEALRTLSYHNTHGQFENMTFKADFKKNKLPCLGGGKNHFAIIIPLHFLDVAGIAAPQMPREENKRTGLIDVNIHPSFVRRSTEIEKGKGKCGETCFIA